MDILHLESVSNGTIIGLVVLATWSVFWKVIALWQSARHSQGLWFGVLFGVNTLGILEIIYLFKILKLKRNELLK